MINNEGRVCVTVTAENSCACVYGISPDKGKPVSGASDNLRGWWKERVKFDRNGPAAMLR